MIDAGTGGSVYVQALRGNPEKWDSWREIMRVNPLAKVSPEFRAKLKEEREQARGDTRLKARFLSIQAELPHRRRNADALGSGRLSADA